jgi:arylsulfatase A-like enzyme
VLVIVVDTLRADHLSAYGYARPTSPNFDRIAREGVLFDNAISPSSWTLPSHASLLTGRTVFAHGLGNVQRQPWGGWDHSALNGFPTLAEALAGKGYATAGFSANGTFFTPQVGLGRGFLHFEDYFYSAADAFARTLYGRELTRMYFRRIEKTPSSSMLGYGRRFIPRKRATTVNDELLAWLDRRDPHHPFFAFLNYLDVHDPYGAPHGYPAAPWGDATSSDRYDQGIRYADDAIGKLDAELSRRGLARNTILIVTSDHGEALGEHGLQNHGASLYRDLIHVPLLIRYPGHLSPGAHVSTIVGNAAIAATVMDLLGYQSGSAFPGPSLQELWSSPNRGQSPAVISEVMQTDTLSPTDRQAPIPSSRTGWMESVTNSRWHLILHQDGTVQIYDWQDDPAELHNRIATPEGKAAASELMRQLDAAPPPQSSAPR